MLRLVVASVLLVSSFAHAADTPVAHRYHLRMTVTRGDVVVATPEIRFDANRQVELTARSRDGRADRAVRLRLDVADDGIDVTRQLELRMTVFDPSKDGWTLRASPVVVSTLGADVTLTFGPAASDPTAVPMKIDYVVERDQEAKSATAVARSRSVGRPLHS